MKALTIGNLNIPLPIIQGGMGVGVSLSGLAAAVANEGGVGVISAVGIGMHEPNYRKNFKASNQIALRKEIRKARQLSDGVIGVNIMMAVTDFEELLEAAISEKVDIIFIGAGLLMKRPGPVAEKLDSDITKIIPKVSSLRAAKIIFAKWDRNYKTVPDGIVVEGPMAGGHLGFDKNNLDSPEFELENLISETNQILDIYRKKYSREIPVIAGGGVYTGGDINRIFNAGADAVKMGTRFVTTQECDASPEFKQNYIECSKEDIAIIDSPVGFPGRVIKNKFVEDILEGKQKPVSCPWQCLKTCNYKNVSFCIADALFSAARGKFDAGFSFAGSKAYLADKIKSVKEVIADIKKEYSESLAHSGAVAES